MKNTKRIAIMLRPRKDIHERISAAANELDKPITAWVMDAIMERLPKGHQTGPIKEKPLKPKDEYGIVKERIPGILADNRERWIGMKELAGLIGEPATERICWIVGRELGRENKICLTESDDKVQVMKFKSL